MLQCHVLKHSVLVKPSKTARKRMLNLIRTISLFTGAWGIHLRRLGDWEERVAPLAKMFSILLPGVVIGLLQVNAIQDSVVGSILVSSFVSK